MTDLETLLSDAGRAHSAQPTPDSTVDADITRGRRALAHRRMRRTGLRTVVAGALAIGAFAVVQPHDSGTKINVAASPATSAQVSTSGIASPAIQSPAIQLVAYTGAQPAGYTVGTVPDGWEVQGVNNFALVIARQGNPDTDINSFEGKLVVMLQSKDESDRTDGTKVAVGSQTGTIVRADVSMVDGVDVPGDPDEGRLFFTDSVGHRLVIQVPAELHWTNAQFIAFGSSVHANANAEAGRG